MKTVISLVFLAVILSSCSAKQPSTVNRNDFHKTPQEQSNLGYMYDKGEGVPKDSKEAAKWYKLAAQQGDAYAQAILGYMYDKGEGVPKN